MSVYIISYDLKSPGKNYSSLYTAIKSYGTWFHCLDSTWLIETSHTAKMIYSKLKPCLDNNDRIFVARITQDYAGFLPKEGHDWLKDLPF